MKLAKNKIATIAIAIFLLLSMTATITLPTGKAAASYTLFPWISVAPNPIGIGQTATVEFGLNLPPPGTIGGAGDHWRNMTVVMTKPNGNTATLGPFTSDDTGGTYTTTVPDQLGNYTFQMFFPGQTLLGGGILSQQYVGAYFNPVQSNKVTLTVQQQPAGSVPTNPLPTAYWQTPVNALNVNSWYTIAGNWLGTGDGVFGTNTGLYNYQGNYAPYTTAPNSAHIMWTKPVAFGGALGGEYGGTLSSNYYATSQYEPKFAPIIINGILYYTMYPGAITNQAGWKAVDLFTGKELWTKNTTDVLFCGQILWMITPNQYGGIAYLWATPRVITGNGGVAGLISPTEYHLYDAMTGNYVLTIANATNMVTWNDDHGNLIGYYVNTTDNTLNCWNSTACINIGSGNAFASLTPSANSWAWRPPQGAVIDFRLGIEWKAPIATNISGVPLPKTLGFSSTGENFGGCISDGVIVLTCINDLGTNWQNSGYQIEAAYSQTDGHQLWIINRTETPLTRVVDVAYSNGVYTEVNSATAVLNGFSIATGAQLWTTQLTPTSAFDIVGSYDGDSAQGVLYMTGFGGDIWAINQTNGAIIWQTSTTKLTGPSEYNTPYGTWPLWSYGADRETIADGKLFLAEGHEYSPPMFHGAHQLAINITNGQLVWSIQAMDVTAGPAIADGIATTVNVYDNQIYAYGKGPSATTVTAPNVGVTTSTPVTITGSVTDISAGSQQEAVAANFPNGLPAVSDASMSQWMEFVYEQQPCPTNTTGVPVTLSVIDSNNNFRTIGTTTSDASGTYAYTWTPDIPGNYTLIASFGGSNSYYGSTAETHFYASAPPSISTPTATSITGLATTNDLMMYLAVSVIVIIIAIAIVGLLLVRKRPQTQTTNQFSLSLFLGLK